MADTKTIGLTGGIATGKSTIANWLREAGYVVADADAVGRELQKPGTAPFAAIVATFGSHIVATDGTLDRRALRELVFQDLKAREKLNAIMHPAIQAETKKLLTNFAGNKVNFYEAALIFENARQKEFSEVWLSDCSPELQRHRLLSRGIAPATADQIIASQLPRDTKLALATRTFSTDQEPEKTKAAILFAAREVNSK
jgi:dephospho-CoA kinase